MDFGHKLPNPKDVVQYKWLGYWRYVVYVTLNVFLVTVFLLKPQKVRFSKKECDPKNIGYSYSYNYSPYIVRLLGFGKNTLTQKTLAIDIVKTIAFISSPSYES